MHIRSTYRSLEILRGPVFLIVVLLALVTGCNPPAEEEKPVPESVEKRPITEVMNENVDRIMALDGVVMMAIGELKDGTPCIQVYVKSKSDILTQQIGVEIEGHPVDYIISDEIRPMD